MATQVQWRRGTTAQVNAFTGAVGEVVIDTTLHQMSVQDGITAGGFRAALASGGTFNNAVFTGTFTYTPTVAISGTATSTATISGGTYDSPTLIGTPVTPTPPLTSNDQTVPNTTWVRQVIQLTSPINLPLATAAAILAA